MGNENTKETVSASIRNKLSPMNNLATLIEIVFGTEEKPITPNLEDETTKSILKIMRGEATNVKKYVKVVIEMGDQYGANIIVDEKFRN